MTPSLLTPLQNLLNRGLLSSTPARAQLKALTGRRFAILVEAPGAPRLLTLTMEASETGLLLDHEERAEATVTGTPLGLLTMLFARGHGGLTNSGTRISGNAETAAAFEKLLKHAHPDAEAELARLVGDRAAHLAGVAARSVLGWASQAARGLLRSTGEYLTEESRDVVTRAELDGFLGGVDRLREDTDRLAARLQWVITRRGNETPSP
jgi:ubiquinone biosynthesis protein UbiJ